MTTNVFWGGAAISAIIASWALYRLLAPKGWREWTRAGLVQAFIIAFYAEMYGFPLTIYFVARLFDLDLSASFWDGNLWVYLTGTSAAMLVSMVAGYTITFFGIVLLIAGWREVHRARKESRLATAGPYAYVRHPQYTGLFLALFGEGVVHWPTIFSLAAFVVVVFAYTLLARKEERQMIQRFGDAYLEYRRRVPMFVPLRAHWSKLFRPDQLGAPASPRPH